MSTARIAWEVGALHNTAVADGAQRKGVQSVPSGLQGMLLCKPSNRYVMIAGWLELQAASVALQAQ